MSSLDKVQLTDYMDIPVEKFSKGMKQRLQIAKGMINNPKYLFLDEPMLGLDVLAAKEMKKYILRLAKEEKKGILLTTHYLPEAESLCDYIYLIHKGSILAEGSPKEIKELYVDCFRCDIYIDNYNFNIKQKLLSWEEVMEFQYNETEKKCSIQSSKNILEKVIKAFIECEIKILDISIEKKTLEESIIHLLQNQEIKNNTCI